MLAGISFLIPHQPSTDSYITSVLSIITNTSIVGTNGLSRGFRNPALHRVKLDSGGKSLMRVYAPG